MTKEILNKISNSEALTILHQLAKQDKNIKKKIIELAEELMTDIDIEDVCDDVFSAIDFIDVHELWDRSGSNSYGEYTSPEEMAFEMVEEVL